MPKRNTKELTPRQREVLEWIKDFIQEYSMPPTVREIGDAFGMKSSSMFDHLKALERKGYLKRGDKGVRHLILLNHYIEHGDEEVPVMGDLDGDEPVAKVPIVGRVPAGLPLLAEENIIGKLKVEKKYVRSGKFFALEVEGDSMVGAGINEGDFVIVRQQPLAENGDIVVALLGDEATVKKLHLQDEKIELRPANPKHKPISIGPEGEVRILGKVVVVRHSGEGKKN